MVNWKSKYLEMKLKYINAKNKLIGGLAGEQDVHMGPSCDDVMPNVKVEHLPFNTGFITNASVQTRICVGGLLDCFGIFIKISAYPDENSHNLDLLAIIAAHCNPSTIYDTLTDVLTPYGINFANNLIHIFNNRIVGIDAGNLEIETTIYADAEQIELGITIQNTINAAIRLCEYLRLNQNLINCINADNPYPSLNGQEWKDIV
tara:strand:- start:197 stop:808 length:612 start_codon:yes stop_codon:yes gene_type:complete